MRFRTYLVCNTPVPSTARRSPPSTAHFILPESSSPISAEPDVYQILDGNTLLVRSTLQMIHYTSVFNNNAPNYKIYNESACFRSTLEAGSGLSSCHIFYGIKGSGKTKLFLGTYNNPGLVLLFVQDIFKELNQEENKNSKNPSVVAQFLQYSDRGIRDLLIGNYLNPDDKKDTTAQIFRLPCSTFQQFLVGLKVAINRNVKRECRSETFASANTKPSMMVVRIHVRVLDKNQKSYLTSTHSFIDMETGAKKLDYLMEQLAYWIKSEKINNQGVSKSTQNFKDQLLRLLEPSLKRSSINIYNSFLTAKSKFQQSLKNSRLLGGLCITDSNQQPSKLNRNSTIANFNQEDRSSKIVSQKDPFPNTWPRQDFEQKLNIQLKLLESVLLQENEAMKCKFKMLNLTQNDQLTNATYNSEALDEIKQFYSSLKLFIDSFTQKFRSLLTLTEQFHKLRLSRFEYYRGLASTLIKDSNLKSFFIQQITPFNSGEDQTANQKLEALSGKMAMYSKNIQRLVKLRRSSVYHNEMDASRLSTHSGVAQQPEYTKSQILLSKFLSKLLKINWYRQACGELGIGVIQKLKKVIKRCSDVKVSRYTEQPQSPKPRGYRLKGIATEHSTPKLTHKFSQIDMEFLTNLDEQRTGEEKTQSVGKGYPSIVRNSKILKVYSKMVLQQSNSQLSVVGRSPKNSLHQLARQCIVKFPKVTSFHKKEDQLKRKKLPGHSKQISSL